MARVVRCPICRAKVPWQANPHRPFCSERCRLTDLGAWAEGRYRIAGERIKPEDKKEDNGDEKESP